ncbi:MAG: hypothetical protein ACFFC7_05120 [Candidatus Hermodarchaeota archaeon]
MSKFELSIRLFFVILLFFSFSVCLPVSSQTVEITGSQTYGGSDLDDASTLLQTSDGGFALAGSTESYDAGQSDAWLIKTYANGTMQWSQTYGGSEGDYASALLQTSDGGFVLVGGTSYSGVDHPYDEAWLIKTDINGVMQWNRTYEGFNILSVLVQTSDGGFALAGTTLSDLEWPDILLMKTFANGTLQWNRTYGGSKGEQASALVQMSDGGFVLAGYTCSYGAGQSDAWLLKTDSNGFVLWDETYGGSDYDSASALVQISDGGFAFAGDTYSYSAGRSDAWLVKTYANGTMQWNETYGGSSWDGAWALLQTSDGGFVLAGYTYSYGAGQSDAWLLKTDSNGFVLWDETYGGSDYDSASALVQISDGGFAFAGHTFSYGAGQSDAWLVRINVTEKTGISGVIIISVLAIIILALRRGKQYTKDA